MNILQKIQSELKANKSQYNNFGGYSYRSCEDILEAAKPVLAKYEASITLTDEIVLIGDRYYVKATATLKTKEITESVSAFAREEAARKSFDVSQITGSASSYARKYALSGLFALDDTKDADTMDNREKPTTKPQKKADDNVIQQINNCKSVRELINLFKKLEEETGDAFPEVKAMYQVAFAKRKQEILNANN